MVTSHNAFYGLKTPKGTGKYLHTIHGLLVFLFPFGLWYVAGWDPRSLFVFPSGSSWQYVAAGYVALCWLTGFVLFPLNTKPVSQHSARSEEHTSELQSHLNLVCRLLLAQKNYPLT